jgi:hypothetical protein
VNPQQLGHDADKTTASFFHVGAVFLLHLAFDAIVDSSEAVGARPRTWRSYRSLDDVSRPTTLAHNDDGPP